MEVLIDRFRWPDIPAAAAIETESFPSGAWKAESFWNELAPGLQRSVYLAARVGGDLVGYIGVVVDADDAHLHTLTVGSIWRGRGIAKMLLDAATQELAARECRRWLLEVSEHNEAAIGLYRGYGFSDLALRNDYYAPGDSAVVMELDLSIADVSMADGGRSSV